MFLFISRRSWELPGLQGLCDVVIEANVRRWFLFGVCAGGQENEVAGAVRDQTVVAVAGGAANSASTGSRRSVGIFSLAALSSAEPVSRGVFWRGFLRIGSVMCCTNKSGGRENQWR